MINQLDSHFLKILSSRKSVWFVSFLVIGFAYWPLIDAYGVLDDYSILYLAPNETNVRIFLFAAAGGRPLQGALVHAQYHFTSFDPFLSLTLMHLVTLLLVVVAFVFLVRYLERIGFSQIQSAAITLFTFLLTPGILIIIGWTVLLSAGLALLMVSMALFTFAGHSKLRAVYAFAFVTSAMLIYQPVAMLFLVFWLLPQIFRKDFRVFSRSNFTSLVIIFTASSASFISAKITNLLTNTDLGARSNLIGDPGAKLDWILQTYLHRALGSHFIFADSQEITRFLLVSVFLLFSVLAFLARWGIRSFTNRFVFLLTIFILSSIPNLLTSENWASHRSLLAPNLFVALLCSLLIFHLYKELQHLRAVRVFMPPTLLLIIIIQSIYVNSMSNDYWAAPQLKEINVTNSYILDNVLTDPFCSFPSHWSDSQADRTSFDEFGYPSTSAGWVHEPFLKLLLNKNGIRFDPKSLNGNEGCATFFDFHQILNSR